MKAKRMTLLFAVLVSMFLITSGLSVALTGGNGVGSYTSDIIDNDHNPLDGDGNESDDDGPGESGDHRQDDNETDDDDNETDEDDGPGNSEEHRDDDNETDEDNETEDDEDERGKRDEHEDETPEWDKLIGYKEAINKTYQHANGTILEFKLEDEEDSFVYKVELVNETKEFEVIIDAYSGELIEFETDENDDDIPDWDQLIGHEEAIKKALQKVNGTVMKSELSEDDDNYTYEIEIQNETEEYEFVIDADTGTILEFKREDDEHERERRRERGIGRFWNGTEGRFVSFELLENGIKNYTLTTNNSELLLFESVTIEGLTIEESESKKVFYELEGNDSEIKIYDVAPALMKMEVEAEDSENRTVSFDLGALEVTGQDGPNLILGYENHTAKLLSISEGEEGWNSSLDISMENGTIDYTFQEEMFMVFRMTDQEDDSEMDEDVTKGISKGEVGGEVVVDRDEKGYSDISVNYSDMKMKTEVKEKNRVQVEVSSDTLEEGKVVSLKVYKDVLDIDDIKELQVMFDDEEISLADDYEDLTNTSDGAEYLVSIGAEEVQVLVMIPHFSTHTIDLLKTGSSASPVEDVQNIIPVIVLTVLGITAVALVIRKNKD